MRGQAGRFGKQRHKITRRHPGNLGHGQQANACASVRVDVVDDFGYTSLANVRILSLAYSPCESTIPQEHWSNAPVLVNSSE